MCMLMSLGHCLSIARRQGRSLPALCTMLAVNNPTYTHTHTRLTALCPGLPGWAGTRKVKPIWILLKQETVSGSKIRWAICKSAPCSRQISTPAPHRSVFTGRMPFLPPNQQRQSTEGTNNPTYKSAKYSNPNAMQMLRQTVSAKTLHKCLTDYTWKGFQEVNDFQGYSRSTETA